MGGGPGKETLVFLFMTPEPKHLTDTLRKKFPYIDLIYYQLGRPVPGPSTKQIGGIPHANEKIPEDLWEKATILCTLGSLPPSIDLVPNLKYTHLLLAGVDHLSKQPLFTDSDIPITTSSGISGPPITEWVLLTTLALVKNYDFLQENQKKHQWDSFGSGLMQSPDWGGKTVGVMGYGGIGRQVARAYTALGSKIHAYTASPRSTPESRHHTGYQLPGFGDPDGTLPVAWFSGTDRTSLHTFLASGLDLLVISVPLTPSTRGVISDSEIDVLYQASCEKAAKKRQQQQQGSATHASVEGLVLKENEGCILVNLSRGPIVDTSALLRALHPKHVPVSGRKLRGACLDVTDPEPLPQEAELWDCPDVIITPHISALGDGYLDRAFEVLLENLTRREKGENMVNVVQRKRGY